MNALARTTVIVPARDEATAIASVVAELRVAGAARVIVVDNGSRDGTGALAAGAGAEVITALRAGYGWACHAGVRAAGRCDLVGFIDGDGSFNARDLERLAAVVARGDADLALGTRAGGGTAPAHQCAGNAFTLALLRALYGVTTPDVGPLRVIRGDLLQSLEMEGSRYAWIVEMLCKAARARARIAALPVAYAPRRGGRSKVSGSLRGSLLAGIDFLRALLAFRGWS